MAAHQVQYKHGGSSGAGGQIQWMQSPQTRPVGCPPGLEYLAQIDQLLIHQQIELFEAITNIEMKNKYQIKNSLGQQVYFAYEESEFCHRVCCGRARGFTMHITDNLNQEVIRIVRPFKCCAGCCWCADNGNCCSMEVQIESPPGQIIGYVKQSKSGWIARFDIQNEHQQSMLKIEGPCCPCQAVCCTGDIDFHVLSHDGSAHVGRIAKQWGGVFREWITKADNFCAQFPVDMDVKMKAVVLASTFLIDYMYFERSKNE